MAFESSIGLLTATIGKMPDKADIGVITQGDHDPEHGQQIECSVDSLTTREVGLQNAGVKEFLIAGSDKWPGVSHLSEIEMQQEQLILPNGYRLEVKLVVIKTEATSDLSGCSYEINNCIVLFTKVELAAKISKKSDTIITTNRALQVIVTDKDINADMAATKRNPLKVGGRLVITYQNTSIRAEDVDVMAQVFPPGLGRGIGTEQTEQLENPLKMENKMNRSKPTSAPVKESTLTERNSVSAIKDENEMASEVLTTQQTLSSNALKGARAWDISVGTRPQTLPLVGSESALYSTSSEQQPRAAKRQRTINTATTPPPSAMRCHGPSAHQGDCAQTTQGTQPQSEDVTNTGASQPEGTIPAAESSTPEAKSSKDNIKGTPIDILHKVEEINISESAHDADQEKSWRSIKVAGSGTLASKITHGRKATVAGEEALPACGIIVNKTSLTSSEGPSDLSPHIRSGHKALGVLESEDKARLPKIGESKESAEETFNIELRSDDNATEIPSLDKYKEIGNGSVSPKSSPSEASKQPTTIQSSFQVELSKQAPNHDNSDRSNAIKSNGRAPLKSSIILKETEGKPHTEKAVSDATIDGHARGITVADVQNKETLVKPKKGFFSIFSFEKEKKAHKTPATNADDRGNKPNSEIKSKQFTDVAEDEKNQESIAINPDDNVQGTVGNGLKSLECTEIKQDPCHHSGVLLAATNLLASSTGDLAYAADISTQNNEETIDSDDEMEEKAKVHLDNKAHGADSASDFLSRDESEGEHLNMQPQLGPQVDKSSPDGAPGDPESPRGSAGEKPPEKRWGFFSFFSFSKSTSSSTPPQSPQPCSDTDQEAYLDAVHSDTDLRGSIDDSGTTPGRTQAEDDSDDLKIENQQHLENSSTNSEQLEIDNAAPVSSEGMSGKYTPWDSTPDLSEGTAGEAECRDATQGDSEDSGGAEKVPFKFNARTETSETDANVNEKPVDGCSDESGGSAGTQVSEATNESAAVTSAVRESGPGTEVKPSRGFFTLFSFTKSTSKSDAFETEETKSSQLSCSEGEPRCDVVGEEAFLVAQSPPGEEEKENGAPVDAGHGKKASSSFWFLPDIGFTEPEPEERASEGN